MPAPIIHILFSHVTFIRISRTLLRRRPARLEHQPTSKTHRPTRIPLPHYRQVAVLGGTLHHQRRYLDIETLELARRICIRDQREPGHSHSIKLAATKELRLLVTL